MKCAENGQRMKRRYEEEEEVKELQKKKGKDESETYGKCGRKKK